MTLMRPKPRGEEAVRLEGVKHQSMETRRKIAMAKMKPVRRIEDGRRYNSIGEAAQAIGVSHTLVSGVCRGKRKHAAGWTFEFINEEDRPAETLMED